MIFEPYISVDENESTPLVVKGLLACPNVGSYFFEAIPKGVLPMESGTAEKDTQLWYKEWTIAYRQDHEVGSTASILNDETLMSYYTQGSVTKAANAIQWSFETTQ